MHENSGKDDITLVQRSVLAMDIRAKICTKIEAKTTVHWYTNKCLTRDIRAKICTKIEAKTTLHWFTNKCNSGYTSENMHEN